MPVSSWSTTASSNATADSASGVSWPEGMSPASVNDSARAMMAETKKWYDVVGEAPPFQCRFDLVSTTQLRLDRCDGKWLFINGAAYEIPSAGVTLSNSGLVANTTYFVYAYMSGSTMTLEASTTTRATDSTYGHQIKSGAATRSLVGMLRTNGSTQFYSSAAELGVISYYNRRSRAVTTTVTGSGSSSTTMVSAISQNIICWGGEGAIHQVTGNAFNSTAGAFCITYATYDGASLGQTTIAKSVVANDRTPVSTGYAISPTEGFHTFGAGIAVNTGSGGWDITVSTLVRN